VIRSMWCISFDWQEDRGRNRKDENAGNNTQCNALFAYLGETESCIML